MIVLDSSVVVSAVLDNGPEGHWAHSLIAADEIFAPEHLLVEAHNVLRRLELTGTDSTAIALAREHLMNLPVELVSFDVVADRTWDLRATMTSYDAAYVALAELIAAPLATLDRRLSRAPGAACDFLLPPDPGQAAAAGG